MTLGEDEVLEQATYSTVQAHRKLVGKQNLGLLTHMAVHPLQKYAFPNERTKEH